MSVRPSIAIGVALIVLGTCATAVPGAAAQAGPLTEFKVPTAAAGLSAITLGSDGAMWFTERDTNKVGRITTAGTITEFTIPIANSKPLGITSAPDGALWFTMSNVNMIGRVTTAGKFSEYTIPTSNTAPAGITYLPSNGKIWFAEPGAGTLGSLTLGGVFGVQTTLGTDAPTAVAAGPLGSVMFASPSTNSYGWANASSNNRGLGATNAAASSIVMGDDGYKWIAQPGAQSIRRMNSVFDTPVEYYAYGDATVLLAGSDRGIWYTAPNSNLIGRMSVAGINTEAIDLPTASSNPTALANGPDGTIWVTEAGSNKIARIATNDVTSPTPTPIVLVAYQATVAKTAVKVNYALTGSVALSLTVKNSQGVSTSVWSGNGKTGVGSITWNRKLKGKAAAKGKYTLTVTASAQGKAVKSSLAVVLK